MPESKRKLGNPLVKISNPPAAGASGGDIGRSVPQEALDQMSALEILDRVASKLPARHLALMDLVHLRERIETLEVTNDEARQAVEKLDEIVERLRAPALRVGTFLKELGKESALVSVNGQDYVCKVNPEIVPGQLQIGQRVLCNEAFAVVRGLGFDPGGPVARIDELLSEGRIRVGQESGFSPAVVVRSALLEKEKLKPGMEVRLDANQRVALEIVSSGGRRIERALERVPHLPWSAVGGQEAAVQAIRDTLELPFLHRELFNQLDHSTPKGFLLYGPPGCGKTLLGKATAYNLREQIKARSGQDHPEFFLHIKGPEILNMWVGESERQVRDLFAQCRERAREGALAFLFVDEAESILGTRHGGRHPSMAGTLVPMFCTEMDGLEPLENVVVILASNRADLIDPAILRPGRIDRKIKVRRPAVEGAKEIYKIYLTERLPLREGCETLAQAVAERHFARIPENEFLEVLYRSGRREVLYRGDLASGAVIAGIVERAKGLAIKRAITERSEARLLRSDLFQALELEHAENDLFPASDTTEDWLRLTDFEPGNVIKLGPIQRSPSSAARQRAV